MNRLALAAALGVLLGAATPQAHHSLAGVYDSSKRVTVRAVVREFHFVNPHPFLVVEGAVEGAPATGAPQRWRLELDNRSELSDVGMKADTFLPGQMIVAAGMPARTQAQMLYVRSLDRPADGFHYEQVGSSPAIRR